MTAQTIEKEILGGSDGMALGTGGLSSLCFCVFGRQFLDLQKLYCQENQYSVKIV